MSTKKRTGRNTEELNRRGFMALTALGAVAPIGLRAPAVDDKDTVVASERAGYRETEHVRTYYRSTRL